MYRHSLIALALFVSPFWFSGSALFAQELNDSELGEWVTFEQLPYEEPSPAEPAELPGVVTMEDSEPIIPPAPSVEERFSLPPEGTEIVVEELPELYDFNRPGWYSTPDWHWFHWRTGSGDRFGDFSLEGTSAEPIEAWDGLSFTHGHGFHFLDGPNRTDMPPRLFDFHWGLHWFGNPTSDTALDVAFSAGLFTDFEDSARQGWRFPAHAVLTWNIQDEVQPVVGLRYFDRDVLELLPVAGLIIQPEESIRLELVFPEPKVAWRVSADSERDRWLSVSGKIGGGEWAIERSATGLADVVSYVDYQLVCALETVGSEKVSVFEFGYIFSRDLEYRSGAGNYRPPSTFFVRLGSRR